MKTIRFWLLTTAQLFVSAVIIGYVLAIAFGTYE